ncbi:Unconventional myosin-XIX [Manis javanica]|nr:Unconventional myosin-XIX [Manis javanica]
MGRLSHFRGKQWHRGAPEGIDWLCISPKRGAPNGYSAAARAQAGLAAARLRPAGHRGRHPFRPLFPAALDNVLQADNTAACKRNACSARPGA